MGKYTKAPDMHEFAYNSWLLKIHRRLNDRAESARLNRDGFRSKYRGPESEWWKSALYSFKIQIPCGNPELFIIKTKRVNCNPAHTFLTSYPCNMCLQTSFANLQTTIQLFPQ